MREAQMDLWQAYDRGNICCVTTNGYVKRNGEAVMGRGTAKQAAERWPQIPRRLGSQLAVLGNRVQFIHPRLLAFPVKGVQGTSTVRNVVAHMAGQFPSGSIVPGWAMVANVALIERSLLELSIMREPYGWGNVYLPRPGCGAGELDWERQVKPLCELYGDWLVIVSMPVPQYSGYRL